MKYRLSLILEIREGLTQLRYLGGRKRKGDEWSGGNVLVACDTQNSKIQEEGTYHRSVANASPLPLNETLKWYSTMQQCDIYSPSCKMP